MAPQHVEIAETVAALRKKLRRDRQVPSTQPASVATNRGNKLLPGAQYVHAGSLPWRAGPITGGRAYYTEKVNHAGFDREILGRIPRHDDVDSDLDDEDTEQVNPYADVRIEEILRPLTHPSHLATHPAMSLAYTDPALNDMVESTESKIREERTNLWRAKNLYRYFTGDESWIPCGKVEADADWDMFGPHPGFSRSMKRRKLSGDLTNGTSRNSMDTPTTDLDEEEDITMVDEVKEEDRDEEDQLDSNGLTNGVGVSVDDEMEVNGVDSSSHSQSRSRSASPPRRITRALANAETQSQQPSPPLSPSPLSSPPVSPSQFEPDPLFLLPAHLAAQHAPHPIHNLSFDLAHAGLPPEELRETRKLLGMFIQKSEETIRGLENIHAKLIKAKRRRDILHAWCVAEGHLGELSDGEDWIDETFWGCEGELKKGKDDDGAVVAVEVDEHEVVMGRNKNRRRRANNVKE